MLLKDIYLKLPAVGVVKTLEKKRKKVKHENAYKYNFYLKK